MASKPLSNDQQNFTLLGIACIDLIKKIFEDILRIQVEPKDLYNAIRSCSELTTGRCKLRPEQQNICYLPPPLVPDYDQFDTSLLYTLIRNLCPNLKPTKGWGNIPASSDLQIGDDIERLRLFRNGMFAHLKSTAVPDTEFTSRWKQLRNILPRTQAYVNSKGYTSNYEKELSNIEKTELGCKNMEKYKILLQGLMHLLQQSENEDMPKIKITGEDKVLCGKMVVFEAIIEHSTKSLACPIIWQRVRSNGKDHIDFTKEKYSDSTRGRLVIQRVSKEDEGEYQATISWVSGEQTHSISSNCIVLRALGERPTLKTLNVTTGKEGITIHYQFEVIGDTPEVEHITWTKNNEALNIFREKYLCGGLMDRYLTITSPTNEDRGTYTCTVTNAVGEASQCLSLDLPDAKISTENLVVFGNETQIDSKITSCPECEGAIWQKSSDSVTFEAIDIGDPKYYGSKQDPKTPVLVLRKATFDDKLYYRLLAKNKIGECLSNTVYMNVTGGPPNISNFPETNISERSVSLICEVFLYENSPPLKDLVWMKNGDLIDIAGSGGKYTGGTIGNATLVINDVNQFDAGSYLCKASNALGSTSGNVIILSVPEIQIQRSEKKENGTLVFSVTLNSSPVAFFVQWSKKNEDNDEYTPIDINTEEYRGTSNSLPNPVLVIKQVPLHNPSFKFLARNFIGISTRKIPDDSLCPKESMVDNKANNLAAIYNKMGSSIRFNNLRLALLRGIHKEELISLKETLKVLTSMELSADNATTKEEFFSFLLDNGIFKEQDVIIMQHLLRSINRQDLEMKCVEYAIRDKQCYFVQTKPAGDGHKHIQLHIADDIENFYDLDSLLATVAAIAGCDQDCIELIGLHPESSFIVVISMKEEFAQKLKQKYLGKLLKYNVDWIDIDNEVFYISQDSMDPMADDTWDLNIESDESLLSQQPFDKKEHDDIEQDHYKPMTVPQETLNISDDDKEKDLDMECSDTETTPMRFSFQKLEKVDTLLEKVFLGIRNVVTSPEFDDFLQEKLSQTYSDYFSLLKEREDLFRRGCEILVVGDTRVGKSTLINSILGEKILETDVFASTRQIFKIIGSDSIRIKTFCAGNTLLNQYQNISSLQKLKSILRKIAVEDAENETGFSDRSSDDDETKASDFDETWNTALDTPFFVEGGMNISKYTKERIYGAQTKSDNKADGKLGTAEEIGRWHVETGDEASDKNSKGKVCSEVEIYYPSPKLKGNFMIVESPGFGKSEELDQRLRDYIKSAASIIFVTDINLESGLQKDRMFPILNEIQQCQLNGFSFDPSDVIFLSNKWDIVFPDDEEKKKETENKIKEVWPSVRKDHIFFLSIGGIFKSKNEKYLKEYREFEKVAIEVLEANEDKRAKTQYRFLEEFFNHLVWIVLPRYKALFLLDETKSNTELEETQSKIDKLIKTSAELRQRHELRIQSYLTDLTEKVHSYLQTKVFQEKILSEEKFKWSSLQKGKISSEVTKRIEEEIAEKIEREAETFFESIRDINMDYDIINKEVHEIYTQLTGLRMPYRFRENLPFSNSSNENSVLFGIALKLSIGLLSSAVVVGSGVGFLIGAGCFLLAHTYNYYYKERLLKEPNDAFAKRTFTESISGYDKSKIRKMLDEGIGSRQRQINSFLCLKVEKKIRSMKLSIYNLEQEITGLRSRRHELEKLKSKLEEVGYQLSACHDLFDRKEYTLNM